MPRRRAWCDFFVNQQLVEGTPQSANLLTQAPDLDTMTVARLIGRLYVSHDSLTAQVDSRMMVEVGIGVASQEAFAVAGAAGLPIVGAAASAPPRGWLYRGEMQAIKVHSSGTTYEVMMPDKDKFDLGAMRKVDKGVLFLIADTKLVGGTTATIRMTGLIRTMVLT